MIRPNCPASNLVPLLRQRIQETDPTVRLDLSILKSDIRQKLSREELLAWLSGMFGALATLLVLLGLYGLLSYMTQMRTNELGIRIALGAQKRDLLTLVLGQALRIAAIGVLVGIVLSLFSTRLLRGLLFGISPTEPRQIALSAIALGVVALLAGWFPARRAMRIDPLTALRHE